MHEPVGVYPTLHALIRAMERGTTGVGRLAAPAQWVIEKHPPEALYLSCGHHDDNDALLLGEDVRATIVTKPCCGPRIISGTLSGMRDTRVGVDHHTVHSGCIAQVHFPEPKEQP